MAGIKVIITGATGMVGEGVLFECLRNEKVSEILIVNRRHYELTHPKLKELIVPDFLQLDKFANNIRGYDACFFCSGVSSVGKNEDKYRHLTYDITLAFAKIILANNPNIIFTYVSGSHTDGTEKSSMMWARVKGKTENDLARLGFKGEYNFRPGAMLPFKTQKNWKAIYKLIVKIIRVFAATKVLTMKQVGKAMITCATVGYSKNVLEVDDIRAAAAI